MSSRYLSGSHSIQCKLQEHVLPFIEKQCFASHKLVICNYIKGGEPTVSREEWAWQPLDFTHPTNDQVFELPLRWDRGTVGLFTVECGIFTPMDEELITLLHTVARMLEDAVQELEGLELSLRIWGLARIESLWSRGRLSDGLCRSG